LTDQPSELDFSPMFEPLTVRGLTLRNRFIMPAMQRRWCEGGRPLPHLVEYYCRRVEENGTALVITESCAVDHPTSTQVAHYGWISESTKDAWRDCVSAVRAAGGEMFIQLWHEGAIRSEGGDGPYSAYPTLSPSGLARAGRPSGRAATSQELAEIKDAFVRGAVIAQEIGAAGVEVHACHGYFLDQFLWAETNRRTDGYGGDDIGDRVRYPAEIVAEIRDAVGRDFVISFRFSQWKEVDYEAQIVESPAEMETMLGVLRRAGVDIFHVSARRFWEPAWPGSDLGLAGWAASLTDAHVAAVGSVGFDLDVMESLLGGTEALFTGEAGFQQLLQRFNAGEFHLISIGRGQIGDAALVRKLREGRLAEIRPFTRADVRNRDPGAPEGGGVPAVVAEAHANS
jgi:2,4-dienoyl-CoA reductase-like NADH-dependent reductase (Old Yellow Enzyme family)